MPKTLNLSLLGKLQVSLDDQPVTGFVSTKVPALLCYLAVTGRPHDRQGLAGLLWGEMPETEAKANLRTALSNLKKLVGPYLVIERDVVTFNRDSPYRLDVELFESALSRPPAAIGKNSEDYLERLVRSVELYRGDFLEGLSVREALEFEMWRLAQRERLHQLALQGLHHLSLHYTGQGDYAQAMVYTARLLVLEPGHEEGHRQMMLLLARSGQRSAALAQYETCRRILNEELGVEPAAETAALYERLRAAGTPPPHNLSLPATPFVGRQVELARLAVYLEDPACRLVTLAGPGGAGKTRLALQAAAQAVQHATFRDGVFFISLAALKPGPDLADTLVVVTAAALGFDLAGLVNPRAKLLQYLRPKELLLVLDNLEHLLAPGAGVVLEWLGDLLRLVPGLKLLVTSQERLNLQEEWRLEVGGLESASAAALFAQHARQARAGFSLSEADTPQVNRICRLVEGLPLALELAAGWLRVSSCAEIADEIERSLDFLTTSLRNVPARQRSLRAVFDHSWSLLSLEEQALLPRLSVFRGGFRREAVQSVAGASLRLLAGLVDKSLLGITAEGRYSLHELLRGYAAEKLAGLPGEPASTRERHARYYAGFLREWRQHFEKNPTPEFLAELHAETDNIRTGWEQVVASERTISGAGVNQYWYLGRFDQVRMAGAGSLTGLQAPDPSWDRGLELHESGRSAYYQGDYAAARRFLAESLVILAAAGDAIYLARSRVLLGMLAYDTGDKTGAEPLLRQGLLELKTAGEHRYRSYALTYLGRSVGQPASVKGELEASLAISREVGDIWAVAHTLKNLGHVLFDLQQETGRAFRFLEESVSLCRQIGDPWSLASALAQFGRVAAALQAEPAVPTLQEALAVSLTGGFIPVALEIIATWAALRLGQRGPEPDILAGLALALDHPAGSQDTRRLAKRLLAPLEAELSPEAKTAAWAAARLDEVTTSLLAGPM